MASIVEINTEGFTNGLVKLTKLVCDNIGLTAYGHKKMADAESYAALKKVETEYEIKLLNLKREEQIHNYLKTKEERKFNNVQSVIGKTASYLNKEEPVSDELLNDDWINRFFSIVENISDDTLQTVWGRILAGEIKQPKSFSLRTLDLLKNITKEEAALFIKASKFYIEKDFICTEEFALSLHEVLTLGEIGLLNNESLTKTWNLKPNSKLEIVIDKETLFILHNNKDYCISCQPSIKKLSKAGIELLSLTEKADRNDVYKMLAQHLKSKGVSHVFKHKIIDFEDNCKYLITGEEL